MRFTPSFDVKHEGVRRVFALMLPVILGLSLPQVDVWINRWFGNLLAVGAVTALDNANRLMQVPYGVFGQALGTAIFPTLSALAAQRLWADYRAQLSQGIRGIIFLTLPASVLMMILAVPNHQVCFRTRKDGERTGYEHHSLRAGLLLRRSFLSGRCRRSLPAALRALRYGNGGSHRNRRHRCFHHDEHGIYPHCMGSFPRCHPEVWR